MLKYFSQAKSALPHQARDILKAICETSNDEDATSYDTTIHGDKILNNICVILNTKAWVVTEEMTITDVCNGKTSPHSNLWNNIMNWWGTQISTTMFLNTNRWILTVNMKSSF